MRWVPLTSEVVNTETWMDWLVVERVTVYGILLLIIIFLTSDRVITRRSADREKDQMREGYRAKDSAYQKIIDFKDDQIHDLNLAMKDRDVVIKRRDDQVGFLLEEMAPTILAWDAATKAAAKSVVEDGEDVTSETS